jgi:hypothetical protein
MDLGLIFFAIAIIAFFIRILFYKEKTPQMLVLLMMAMVFAWIGGYWITFPMHTVTYSNYTVSNVPLYCAEYYSTTTTSTTSVSTTTI